MPEWRSSPPPYKGYAATVVFDHEAGVYHGELSGVRDVVTFEADQIDDIEGAFHESVDDYLAMCAVRGEHPDSPTVARGADAPPPPAPATEPETVRCDICERECDPVSDSDAAVTRCAECAAMPEFIPPSSAPVGVETLIRDGDIADARRTADALAPQMPNTADLIRRLADALAESERSLAQYRERDTRNVTEAARSSSLTDTPEGA